MQLGSRGDVHVGDGQAVTQPEQEQGRERGRRESGLHGPVECFARVERHDPRLPAVDFGRHRHRGLLQRDPLLIGRETVEGRTVEAGEGFEMAERPLILEYLDVAFERKGRVEDTRAAAGGFLGMPVVWRAVGAEEILGRPAEFPTSRLFSGSG